MTKALILVDLQNDFIPKGSLAVPQGNEVIAIANALPSHFECIVATQDWHPSNHGSFAVNHPGKSVGDRIELAGLPQVLWPVHCVQGTEGAALVADLQQDSLTKIFQKGSDPCIDSYSGFFDNGHRKPTGLGDYLKMQHVSDVYIMGLALDYCVKYTVLDACQLGFKTYLIEDGCRAVNLNPEDGAIAIKEMQAAGANIIQSSYFS
ncbi:bifunctional nicotinamidase/pyrazinamidase [Rickettsiella endosymbiont of Dermanyssus gallinae]|uniref:bifunctional nicotinamidase/pyrazinamidase n=1 Tax=Rickettsiella endosymbiont of Dermanyssus gallinae TaxID=2856608 RepID=UPI001C52F7B2|nr:bifunctional nicotinamidase/pyrazinamidase [Rickettsiella endosymbiont of Dermanyssus gallinae]